MAMVSCSRATSLATFTEAAPCGLRTCMFPHPTAASRLSILYTRSRRPAIRASINWSQDVQADAHLRDLTTWLKQQGFPDQVVELKKCNIGEVRCFTTKDLQAGDFAIRVPENFTVTCTDVANHPIVAQLAAGRPDLIGLAFWLMYERWLGTKSLWYPYLRTFPSTTLSPIAWSKVEQETLLKGTSVAEEVQQRCLFLEEEFMDIMEISQSKLKDLPQGLFTLDSFKDALSVISSRAIYLPSAELYALVPFADAVNVSGECETSFEYSAEEQSVILRVDKSYTSGQQVCASYGQNRPNSDLLISYGFVDENNKSDFIEIEVGLVKMDPLRVLKLQILQVANFQDEQSFPLYLDRFPTQV